MDRISRREAKIFLTVFLLLGLFAQWYGVNANSRMDLTRAIVETGDLDIDPYHNNTGDRSRYNEHYYSDKAPGLSLIAAPVYASWRAVYSIFGDTRVDRTPRKTLMTINDTVAITAPTQPGAFYRSALLLLILLTATLPVALLSVLIYRVSEPVLDAEWKRLAATFGFAFGTLITHYGTTFLPAAAAALFGFGSFYLLYRTEEPSQKRMVAAGLIGGFAVTLKATAVVILFATFVYAWRQQDRVPVFYIAGGFLGGIPYMLYNTIAFGAPWRLPRSFVDPTIWGALSTTSGLRVDPLHNLAVSLRLLISPYRGLFYWFPLLIFSLIGFRPFFEEERDAAITTAIVFLGTIGLASLWWAWWHGGSFGPRLLVTMIPFLMLPVIYGIRSFDGRIITIFLILSVTINMAGFHGDYEDMLKDRDAGSQMVDTAKKNVDSPVVLANPIKTYYLPGLIQHGPQSRILNGLYNGQFPPDIRAYSSYERRAPILLLGWVLVLLPALIWQRNIRAHLAAHRERILSQVEKERG